MYFDKRIAKKDCINTMVDAPKATKTPLRLPLSTQDFATVIFTKPGGITPPSAAKNVNKKSLDSSKSDYFTRNLMYVIFLFSSRY